MYEFKGIDTKVESDDQSTFSDLIRNFKTSEGDPQYRKQQCEFKGVPVVYDAETWCCLAAGGIEERDDPYADHQDTGEDDNCYQWCIGPV